MKKCKICEEKTEVVFNIGFKVIPICEKCATDIFIQQAIWYTRQEKNLPTQQVNNTNQNVCNCRSVDTADIRPGEDGKYYHALCNKPITKV